MKKKYCFKWFWVMAIFLVSCSHQKKVEIRNNNGIVIESYFVDKDDPNKKEGVYNRFYDDGKIQEVSLYKNGKLNGERKLYQSSGKLMQTETYVNDKYEGPFKSYYDDGTLQQEGNYKDNMMSGVWKNYYQIPNVEKNEMTLVEGKISGPAKEYYPNGKLNAEGNKIEIAEGVDVYDGKVNVYDSAGTLEKVLTYDKGRQIAKEEEK